MSRFGRDIEYNIRWVKPNDPYYWEVDNLPIQDLQENCIRLQNQIYGLPDFNQFITGLEAGLTFVDQTTYNSRRFEDFATVNFSEPGIGQPYNRYVVTYRDSYGQWMPHDLYTRTSKVTHQPGTATTRGLEDILTSTATPNDRAVLKYIVTNGIGKWTDDIDLNFDNVLNKSDAEVTGSIIANQLVEYNGSKWTNSTVLPNCSQLNNLDQGCILAWDEVEGAFTPRNPDSITQAFPNVPGQSGFFAGVQDGINLLQGVDSPYPKAQWNNTWLTNPGSNTLGAGNIDPGQTLDMANVAGGLKDSTAYNPANQESAWINRLSYDSQGETDNWTRVESNITVNKEINLSTHTELQDKVPPGATHLHGWAWVTQYNDIAIDIKGDPDFPPRVFLSCWTAKQGSASRYCPTIVCAHGADEMWSNRSINNSQVEIMIPINWDDPDNPHCYVDLFSWNAAVRPGPSCTYAGDEIPSYVMIRVDGWVS